MARRELPCGFASWRLCFRAHSVTFSFSFVIDVRRSELLVCRPCYIFVCFVLFFILFVLFGRRGYFGCFSPRALFLCSCPCPEWSPTSMGAFSSPLYWVGHFWATSPQCFLQVTPGLICLIAFLLPLRWVVSFSEWVVSFPFLPCDGHFPGVYDFWETCAPFPAGRVFRRFRIGACAGFEVRVFVSLFLE